MARLKVLITVTTYPLPSKSYDELVCTAGFLEDGTWIRIYPIPFSFLQSLKKDQLRQGTKYSWIELDLEKRTDDFRPESYRPVDYNFKDLIVHDRLSTENNWDERKQICLNNVYTNIPSLINDSKDPKNVSLAVFKPAEILDLIVEEDAEDWKEEWLVKRAQLSIAFEEEREPHVMMPKIPYKFKYKFRDDEGNISILMIEDWELGQLYLNCCKKYNNKAVAIQKVREKYLDKFKEDHDIYLFLGTAKTNHAKRYRNPFMIIGVFYPLKEKTPVQNPQLALF